MLGFCKSPAEGEDAPSMDRYIWSTNRLRMYHRLLFPLSILFSLTVNMAAARTGSISGHVLDANGKPAVFASVLLLRDNDSALVKTELTNEKGEYDLTPVDNGTYRVKVVLMGYETYVYKTVAVSNNSPAVPDIILNTANKDLKEVTVSAQKPFIEVHPDKLVVNVENSIVSAGSSVLEVLSRAPGVTVDQNDNISLKGKQGVNIMIDGRVVPVSAADLANMLKSMPSNSVDKIEVISNPSAKYDAAGTAGIINIKTKRDKKMGFNGSVTGTHAQGVYPKEIFGLNINYRAKNLNIYASYNASYRTGFSHVDWNRRFYKTDTFNGAFVQENFTRLHFNTNMATLGVDYNLSSKTSVGATVSGENFYLGTSGYYYANVFDPNDQLQSHFVTNNTSGGNWNNYAPNVHLKHTFDSTGREISVDLDYANYWSRSGQDFTTRYLALDGSEFQPAYILHGDIGGNTQIRSLKADYTHPTKSGARFEAGIKSSFVTADNEPKFYNMSSGSPVYDAGISDHYVYNENINAVYVNASKDWKKFSGQFGLRTEQTVIDGIEKTTGQTFKNDYLQLFPSFAVQDHINSNNDLGITLSRRIERPGYEDLNPYIFFVDPSTYKIGNPHLQPALTYAVELSHVYKQRFITTLSYSQTTNVITEVIKPSTTQEKTTIQTKDNLATMNYFGLSGAYTIPVFKWWTNVTNFDAYYAQYQGNLSNTNLNDGKPTFDINCTNKFTFPKNWSGEFTVFYQAPQLYGFLNLEATSMINFGIQKTLMDKKLTIKASANDIFLHGNPNGSSYFTNYTEVFSVIHDTRQAAISVTYRFGKNTVAPVRKHSGGAEEEKNRASQKGA